MASEFGNFLLQYLDGLFEARPSFILNGRMYWSLSTVGKSFGIFLSKSYLVLISDFFFGGGRGHEQERARGGDVVMDLEVSLEELYSGNFIEVQD